MNALFYLAMLGSHRFGRQQVRCPAGHIHAERAVAVTPLGVVGGTWQGREAPQDCNVVISEDGVTVVTD